MVMMIIHHCHKIMSHTNLGCKTEILGATTPVLQPIYRAATGFQSLDQSINQSINLNL